ncbi:MAG: hypothetical protein QGH25_01235 [Candidatus Latescibacteria bacterium]|jgi:hypothetical protein|nr:hypothetical protein [Candidatus Latescibacterota bacterium]
MSAKISGVVLMVAGGVMAFELIFPVIDGIIGFVAVAAVGLLAVGALYLGKRWIDGESTLGRIIGALTLIAGALLAFKAALAAVVGVFGAVFLMLKVALVGAMVYVGLRWVQNGAFRMASERHYA